MGTIQWLCPLGVRPQALYLRSVIQCKVEAIITPLIHADLYSSAHMLMRTRKCEKHATAMTKKKKHQSKEQIPIFIAFTAPQSVS